MPLTLVKLQSHLPTRWGGRPEGPGGAVRLLDGLEVVPNSLQRLFQPLPPHPVEWTGKRRSDKRGRRLIGDVQLDPHARRHFLEPETTILLDQARFRNPPD